MSGRGGAGNIIALQQEKARVAGDVEANHQQAVESAPVLPQTQDQEYAHSGRGGAGNYYSPKDLKETGNFSHKNPVASASGQPGTNSSSQAVPVAKYGRGGAGNMSWGVTESEQKAAIKKIEEEKTKREQIEAESEREAGQSIAMPPKAKLPLPGSETVEPF